MLDSRGFFFKSCREIGKGEIGFCGGGSLETFMGFANGYLVEYLCKMFEGVCMCML